MRRRLQLSVFALLSCLLCVVPVASAGGTHTVESGDRLRTIAAEHGVTVDQLREWNGLDGDLIRVGQTLAVREGATDSMAEEVIVHEVRAGEFLGAIASEYGVRVTELREWNDLGGDVIQPGQELIVRPDESERRAAEGGVVRHEVQSGEFLGAIAERHGVSVRQIREWNDLANDTIRPGQRLTIRTSASTAAAASGPSSGDVSSSGWRTHVVESGQTAIGIAQRYGVTLDQLRSWNPSMQPSRLSVGQQLRIGSARGRMVRRIVYEVQPGDFVGRIAAEHNVSVSDISRWNNNLDPNSIRIGQRLVLLLEGPETPSESRGRAHEGRLVNGEQLPSHRGFRIRDERRAWGTNETITYILDGFDHVLNRFPDSPRLMVHDLSYEEGGQILGHRSHQSGRDVDIGYYMKGCADVCEYRNVGRGELDLERQWALMSFWIEQEMVEYMFVDYRLQEELYEWLQRRGATREQLSEWFQYPHGRNSARGIIRHEPGHRNHIHVRFACGYEDDRCR